MNEETKQVMGDGYDMIVELMEIINLMNQALRTNPDNLNFEGVLDEINDETRKVCNKAQGVLDEINDELYKTL